jgi:molecular chaperone GrpE
VQFIIESMRKRDAHQPDAAEHDPPAPEAQGDGEPAPEVEDNLTSAGAGEGAGGTATATDEATRQLQEQREKYLRLAAEYDNYRKRTARERLEAEARGQAQLVSRLLEPIDDLARFADVDPATTDAMTLHKGIEMVEQKMLKALSAAGLELINPLDQPFDPTLHEAVTTEPALSAEDDGMVGRVFQMGYRFNGQLLRPARVVVKQWNG